MTSRIMQCLNHLPKSKNGNFMQVGTSWCVDKIRLSVSIVRSGLLELGLLRSIIWQTNLGSLNTLIHFFKVAVTYAPSPSLSPLQNPRKPSEHGSRTPPPPWQKPKLTIFGYCLIFTKLTLSRNMRASAIWDVEEFTKNMSCGTAGQVCQM